MSGVQERLVFYLFWAIYGSLHFSNKWRSELRSEGIARFLVKTSVAQLKRRPRDAPEGNSDVHR